MKYEGQNFHHFKHFETPLWFTVTNLVMFRGDHLPNLQLCLKTRTESEIDDVFSPDLNIHGFTVKDKIIHAKASSVHESRNVRRQGHIL